VHARSSGIQEPVIEVNKLVRDVVEFADLGCELMRAVELGQDGKRGLDLDNVFISDNLRAMEVERTYFKDLALLIRQERLRGILGETALDHLLDLERLNSEQVENHVVGETELRGELIGRPEHHRMEALGLN
jgi:hypothetical protein